MILFPILASILNLGTTSMSLSSDLDIRLVPLRATYHPGEPIEMVLSIHNLGDGEARIMFAYPKNIGVVFSCDDPSAVIPSRIKKSYGRASLAIEKEEVYRKVFALNRHVDLNRAKAYTLGFRIGYLNMGKSGPLSYEKEGQFTIEIEPGSPDRDRILEHVTTLEEDDLDKVLESAELLLWADNTVVIEPLAKAAARIPDFAPEIVKGLEKFFEEERGKEAILKIARLDNGFALRAGLNLFASRKTSVPFAFFKTVLSSPHEGILIPALEHLRVHGSERHLELVFPLENHPQPAVRDLAAQVATKLVGVPEIP